MQSNANHPAVYISWEDMQAFVRKLNQAEGAEVYRLRKTELGFLVRDRVLAVSVSSHSHGLVDQGLLSPMPTR